MAQTQDAQQRAVLEIKLQLSKLEPAQVDKTLDLLKRLDEVEITSLQVISKTDIGKVVGNLRKHDNAEINNLAKNLVNKWKKLMPSQPGTPSRPASSVVSAWTTEPRLAVAAMPSTTASNSGPIPTPTPTPTPTSPFTAKATELIKQSAPALEPLRLKMCTLLVDALLVGAAEDEDINSVASVSLAVENQAFANAKNDAQSAAYKDKVRSLVSNLRNAYNTELRWRVKTSDLSPERLCQMSSLELAPEHARQAFEEQQKQSTKNAMEAKPIESVTDAFQCSRCKQRKCTYFQKQTRSADEPMTTFVTCTVCGNRWKVMMMERLISKDHGRHAVYQSA